MFNSKSFLIYVYLTECQPAVKTTKMHVTISQSCIMINEIVNDLHFKMKRKAGEFQ